jgi:hypothetical protein
MFVILFDESQDKDIAGEIKNRYYLSPGGFGEEPGWYCQKNMFGLFDYQYRIARIACCGRVTIPRSPDLSKP